MTARKLQICDVLKQLKLYLPFCQHLFNIFCVLHYPFSQINQPPSPGLDEIKPELLLSTVSSTVPNDPVCYTISTIRKDTLTACASAGLNWMLAGIKFDAVRKQKALQHPGNCMLNKEKETVDRRNRSLCLEGHVSLIQSA